MKEEYSQQHRRWYDKDPVLSEAVRTLEETDDQTQKIGRASCRERV